LIPVLVFGFVFHGYSIVTTIIIYHHHTMHIIDTIMPTLENLRIQIAPVGFEIDRIVIPAKKMRADKVWLLVHDKPNEDKATPFVEKIQKQLKKEKIEVVLDYHDRLDLFEIIKSVKQIIENEKGNNVYVNLASGSKIQAIACMMACMMFNQKKNIMPFYAEAKNYLGFEGKQLSSGVKNLMQVPIYEIKIPEEKHVDALRIIKQSGGKITKKEMAEITDKIGLISINAEKENYTQARFASLDQNIIRPLIEKWNFIEVEKIGRARWIKFTDEGKNVMEILD